MFKTLSILKQWVVKLLVEDKCNCNRFPLTAFHAVVRQLMSNLGLEADISEEDLKVSVLVGLHK